MKSSDELRRLLVEHRRWEEPLAEARCYGHFGDSSSSARLTQLVLGQFAQHSAQEFSFFTQGKMRWAWLSICLVLSAPWLPEGADVEVETERDWDWGSGLHELLHSFPADSPFVTDTPGSPANCSQRFWLPPSSPICWDSIAEPEEFEQSRLLVLQNRAALRAVTQASGVGEGGASYNQQAREDMQGFRTDYIGFTQTAETMQKVFHTLEEKRRKGTELWTFSSLKEQLGTAKDSIHGREHLANLLEKQLARLEGSLHILQMRLAKLLTQ
ncbi:hypothetical protein AAFF_G00360040 [Aldrovandia affinis]|uniref:Uncharacterized protein n=1 Tax=Aldrovandia affinis TaxID=143900 RepID=A0AAD7SIC5_9TELE|nr:hypothetical protein AAFF_G00360040 [Aldrovandia affinis]